jgi:hypothetical protein
MQDFAGDVAICVRREFASIPNELIQGKGFPLRGKMIGVGNTLHITSYLNEIFGITWAFIFRVFCVTQM